MWIMNSSRFESFDNSCCYLDSQLIKDKKNKNKKNKQTLSHILSSVQSALASPW